MLTTNLPVKNRRLLRDTALFFVMPHCNCLHTATNLPR